MRFRLVAPVGIGAMRLITARAVYIIRNLLRHIINAEHCMESHAEHTAQEG